MKVGFYQFAPRFGNKEENLITIEEKVKKCDFDLLVLPELCTTGYAFTSKDELRSFSEPIPGPTTERIKALIGDRVLIIGIPESKDGKIYNSAVALGPFDPVIYRKIHLFLREKDLFEPGDAGFVTFRFQEVTIGLLICFDWIYPEAARTLTLKGAEIICHPSNLILSFCQDAMVTRSIENRIFIITANRTGQESRGNLIYEFTGRSQITNPQGKILIRADKDESLTVIDIDPALAKDKKVTPMNDLLKDRRREYYLT
ncbi:MAG TPA: hypothetical protein EYP58_04415 [bacterium (Candidatus Stahlbacteria)]|nr:hypothetical protein [Candidatus Stahlbacteria bacterium]